MHPTNEDKGCVVTWKQFKGYLWAYFETINFEALSRFRRDGFLCGYQKIWRGLASSSQLDATITQTLNVEESHYPSVNVA